MLLEAQAEANRTLNSAKTSVNIIQTQATAQALAITRQYTAWQTMYASVKSTHSFTTDALLTYISNRLVQSLSSVELNLESPAQASYKSDLSTDPNPTGIPTPAPSMLPTTSQSPTATMVPSGVPTSSPSPAPSQMPSSGPSPIPTSAPTAAP